MKKLSIGLLAAVAIALAAAPADAATKKKKSGGKKGKAEAAEVSKVDPNHPMWVSCWLSGVAGTKPPGPACGR
jgi:ABC-type oligopeptide transport system substrate-binding subunit